MTELYITQNKDVRKKLKNLLDARLDGYKILTTANGKPYLEGNPLYFSVSHSKDFAVIAICDKPVGVDAEILQDRKYSSVLSRFCEEERAEIADIQEFLKHWVIREAYIKMLGATLSERLCKLKYVNGVLYDENLPVNCSYKLCASDGYVLCVCVDGSQIGKLTIVRI